MSNEKTPDLADNEAGAGAVGAVTWSHGSTTTTATLYRDRTWRVERSYPSRDGRARELDGFSARTLAALYEDFYSGPADGFYGRGILQDLADWRDGTVTLAELPPDGGTMVCN